MTHEPQGAGERRAATVELLFDLTFVFAVTQITHLLEAVHEVGDIIGAIAVLTFLWWMYGGYVWLASHIASARRLTAVLLIAMIGYFYIAVGIPGLHLHQTAILGGGALLVVIVHFAAFVAFGGVGVRTLWFGGINAGAALLLGLSGYLPAPLGLIAEALVIATLVGMALFYSARRFTLTPSHFVERHGLLLIIVFGESVISVGLQLGSDNLTIGLLEAGLALLTVIALWFAYFAADDRRAEHRLDAMPVAERGRAALLSYWFAFLMMIGGLLCLSVGFKEHFGASEEASHLGIWLALGVGLYFGGTALFRAGLGLSGIWRRLAIAILGAGLLSVLHLPAAVMLALTLVIALLAIATDARLLSGKQPQ